VLGSRTYGKNNSFDWVYDADNPEEKSTPAVYYLATLGIRLLRQVGDLPEDELRKRYKDGSRQASFIAKCLLLADYNSGHFRTYLLPQPKVQFTGICLD